MYDKNDRTRHEYVMGCQKIRVYNEVSLVKQSLNRNGFLDSLTDTGSWLAMTSASTASAVLSNSKSPVELLSVFDAKGLILLGALPTALTKISLIC